MPNWRLETFVIQTKLTKLRQKGVVVKGAYWSSPWLVYPNRANKLSTQFKAPYTSSECKILDVISKPLTFAGNSAIWGAVWGPVHILHPLWQGKGIFLNLP